MLDLRRVLASKPKPPADVKLSTLWTTWGEKIMAGEKDGAPVSHPRPLLARERWFSLNGTWECAFVPASDAAFSWRTAVPPEDGWQAIRVPFSPEAPLSGVGRQLRPDELLWYRRELDPPDLDPGERLVLHLDAVDWACGVYVNGVRVAEHTGAYLPFSADVTDALRSGEKNELTVPTIWPHSTMSLSLSLLTPKRPRSSGSQSLVLMFMRLDRLA